MSNDAHNFICYRSNRSFPAPGALVANGQGRMHVYSTGNGPQQVVLLNGFATTCPTLDFKLLIDKLKQSQKVIVIEPFGYGWSSDTDEERTNANIIQELRQGLLKAGFKPPYLLVPHSISGIYALYWVRAYPEEISGIVGIDSSVPRLSQITKKFFLDRVLESKTARKMIRALFPLASVLPSKIYTKEECRTMGFLTRSRFYNQTMQNEKNSIPGNLMELMDATCPARVPAGFVLSSRTGALLDKLHFGASWKELHEALSPGNVYGKIVEIDAGHYLHRSHPEVVSSMVSEICAIQGKNSKN